MEKRKLIVLLIGVGLLVSYALVAKQPIFRFNSQDSARATETTDVNPVVKRQFAYLSQNGNSSCSVSFKNAIGEMPDSARLQGSCCSPMSLHRYSEQLEGLSKFQNKLGGDIPEIPDDPYDIQAGLAKKLLADYDRELTSEEQPAYDYAMENSSEKGPCCCKCWRWFVYGGLAKKLIQERGFTGQQVTELWNLSDGCGGDEEHHHT